MGTIIFDYISLYCTEFATPAYVLYFDLKHLAYLVRCDCVYGNVDCGCCCCYVVFFFFSVFIQSATNTKFNNMGMQSVPFNNQHCAENPFYCKRLLLLLFVSFSLSLSLSISLSLLIRYRFENYRRLCAH